MRDPANRGSATGVNDEDEVVVQAPPYVGVNNRSSARYIGENQAAELLNVDLSDVIPKKRDGFREVQSKLNNTYRGSLLAELEVGPQSRLLVAGFPGESTYACHSPNGPSWDETRVVENVSGTTDTALDVASDQAKGIQGNDLLWLVAPETGKNIHAMDSNGDWRDLGNANASPPSDAVDGVYMLSRMWFIGGDKLYWSKLLPTMADMLPTPAAFDRNNTGLGSEFGGSLNLSPDRGALPVAIVPWREESLICFFKNQIEEVVINPADPIDSTRRRIEGRIGCGARDSIVQVGDEVYFLDQYGNYRALRRNQLGTLEGAIPKPITEVYRGELPGNLNQEYAYRSQAALLEEFLYLAYPAVGSNSCNRMVVLDLGTQRLYGPWEFARPFSKLLVSDIEGGAFRLYALDGHDSDPESRLYRLFDGTFSDNGTAITYRETGRMWELGAPWVKKLPKWYDMEFVGGYSGCTPLLSLRTSENQDFVDIRTKAMEFDGANSFPLVDDEDFPILAADFPLIQAEPAVTVMRGTVPEYHEGDLPLYPGDLPVTEADLPIDGGGGMQQGRFLQYRVTEATNGAPFERIGLRIGTNVANLVLEDEV